MTQKAMKSAKGQTPFRSKEKAVHKQVAAYLKLQYPAVIFRTDFAAGSKMTIGQAVQQKALQSGRAYPDLFIAKYHPAYLGLFLELKRDRDEVYKKDGGMKSDPHIREQYDVLMALTAEGYKAEFAFGFDHAKQIIDRYMNQEAF